MDWAHECGAVIPCYNEAATIGPLVREVRRRLPRVFVVDDGSSDATAAQAAGAGATVLRQSRNRGKGAALGVGLGAAWGDGCRWALTLDGDGQHAPGDIPALLQIAEQTGASLVIGNRMGTAAAMPWLRRSVNRWMSRRLSRLTGRSLPDTQCGFRLIHLETWADLALRTQRFEIESEMLVAVLRSGRGVAFTPVQSRRAPRPSRIRPGQDTLRWLAWYWAALGVRWTTAKAQSAEPAPATPCFASPIAQTQFPPG